MIPKNLLTDLATLAIIILLVVSYCLPWISIPSAALGVGAYDLAEWLTLMPRIYTGDPFLLPALLMRLVLACIGLTAGVVSHRTNDIRYKFVLWLVIIGIMVTLLPPVSLFRGNWGNPNYLQQFGLWVVYMLVVFVGMFYRLQTQHVAVLGFTAILASTLISATLAHSNFKLYEIPIQFGIGFYMTVATALLGAVFMWFLERRGTKKEEVGK